MPFFTSNSQSFRQKLGFASKISGLLLVVAVNGFVFLSNYNFTNAPGLKAINEFVNHATADHQVNATPNTIHFNFRALPIHLMDPAPAFPITLSPFTPAILWLLVFGFMISFYCFCFFRGEEDMNAQFIPAVVIPPPNRF